MFRLKRKYADPKPCKLIIGLGNPGQRYENTKHNAGFWVIDELLRRCGIEKVRGMCGAPHRHDSMGRRNADIRQTDNLHEQQWQGGSGIG